MHVEKHENPMDIHLVVQALWITFSGGEFCSGGGYSRSNGRKEKREARRLSVEKLK